MLRLGEVMVGTLDQVQLVVTYMLVKLFRICIRYCGVISPMNGQHLAALDSFSHLCHINRQPFLHILQAQKACSVMCWLMILPANTHSNTCTANVSDTWPESLSSSKRWYNVEACYNAANNNTGVFTSCVRVQVFPGKGLFLISSVLSFSSLSKISLPNRGVMPAHTKMPHMPKGKQGRGCCRDHVQLSHEDTLKQQEKE